MAKRQAVPPTAIKIEIDGKTYRGSYEIDEDDIITVSSAHHSKHTQAGNTPPDGLAKIMLRELIEQFGDD